MLSFKQLLIEQRQHHHFVMPLMSGKPHTHVGHVRDIIGGMRRAAQKLGVKPTSMIVGLHRGSKTDPLTENEKVEIFKKQIGDRFVTVNPQQGIGGALRDAIAAKRPGANHLHLVVGYDRIKWAHGVKKNIENGVFEPYEVPRDSFDSITVHGPDGEQYHENSRIPEGKRMLVGGKPISGTRLRETIVKRDEPLWEKMIGFKDPGLFQRLTGSKIVVNRPGNKKK